MPLNPQALAAAMRMARKSYAVGGATDMVEAPLMPQNAPPADYSMINPPQPEEPQAPPMQMAKFMSRPSAPMPPRPAPRPAMPNEVSPWSRPPETMTDVNPEPLLPPTSPGVNKEQGALSKIASSPYAAPVIAIGALQYGGEIMSEISKTIADVGNKAIDSVSAMVGRAMNPDYDYHKELSGMWKKRFAAERAAKEHVNSGSQAYREGHIPKPPKFADGGGVGGMGGMGLMDMVPMGGLMDILKNGGGMGLIDIMKDKGAGMGLMSLLNKDREKKDPLEDIKTPGTYAKGGDVNRAPWHTISASRNLMRQGALNSPTPGRTDKLAVTAKQGAYVVPADVVSGLGQGNTMAGTKTLEAMFKTGPYGTTMPKMRRAALPGGNRRNRGFAEGGEISDFGQNPGVDIMAAGGEFIIPPESVAEIGSGDIAHGHDILDAFVQKVRGDTIATMQQLPGPK